MEADARNAIHLSGPTSDSDKQINLGGFFVIKMLLMRSDMPPNAQ